MQRKILILAEGRFSPLKSKTANAVLAYLPQEVVAVVDSTKAGLTAQQVLGYGGNVPVIRTLKDGLEFGPTHMLIGIAPAGGKLPEIWCEMLRETLKARLHILSGLHTILSDDPEFAALAEECGVTITDYRKIPPESEVIAKGTWRNRKAKVVLTVGTDCNIGKMTALLEVYRDMLKRGLNTDFVATGQTGMLLRGRGIAVDHVIGDYIAGCIEREIDQSVAEGYEFILVEGQGSLTHMGYSGVTYGLMHGTMPDAMIMCHQPTRIKDDYGLVLPDLSRLIRLHEEVINIFRPTKVVAIGLNSVGLTDEQSKQVAKKIEDETGLPTVDAFRFGPQKLTDALLDFFNPNKH
ncbi:MAG: DUF1611 domain-containing protein [Ignavibacteria bacterium]|nr:DUF1611 domain-containing protein [Ignavibacteria bacterium]